MDFTYEKLYRIVKANLILIIAGGLLFLGLAFAYSKFLVDPVYYSESKIIIHTSKQNPDMSPSNINTDRMLVESFIGILDTNNFFQRIHSSLPEGIKAKTDYLELKSGTSFTSRNSTEIIALQYKSKKKDVPLEVMRTINESLDSYLKSVNYTANVNVIDDPEPPRISGDTTKTFSILGFVLGMALVFVIILVRESLDVRIKSTNDIVEKHELPVLGSIPSFRGKRVKKEEGINV